MGSIITNLLLLLALHALCDFALQSADMARGKNRHRKPENIPPGQTPQRVWPYWLTAHAAIHGLAVGLVLGPVFGVAEFTVHWWIDFAKSENWTGVHTDQALHVVSKVAWVLI